MKIISKISTLAGNAKQGSCLLSALSDVCLNHYFNGIVPALRTDAYYKVQFLAHCMTVIILPKMD